MLSMLLWLKDRVHYVYLVSGFCAGVLMGVYVSQFFVSSWLVSPWWLCVFGAVAIGMIRCRQRWCIGVVLVAGILFGYTRGAGELAHLSSLRSLFGQEVVLQGVVAEDSSTTKGGVLSIRLGEATVRQRAMAGEYWVTVAGEGAKQIRRSDKVEVRGNLQDGFGSFAATMYRAELLTLRREALRDPFVDLRDWLSEGIHTHLPDPEAALGAGYILGQKQALPVDFEEALRVVGLTHVVVASGYNLTILVRLARRLFARVSRYLAVFSGGAMTLLFVGVTGLNPSMTRAGLVAGISLLVWYYGRTIHPVVLLLTVATLTVIYKPAYIWGDVGWQLSFASFIGVMLFAPLLQAYFFGSEKPGTVRQVLGETFSAQLLTMPIIIVLFGTVSNVALLANLLVLPLVPLAMLLVFLSGLEALWLPWIAPLIAVPTYWLLHYMTSIVVALADMSWASFEVSFGIEFALACYGAMLIIFIWLRRRTQFDYKTTNIVE